MNKFLLKAGNIAKKGAIATYKFVRNDISHSIGGQIILGGLEVGAAIGAVVAKNLIEKKYQRKEGNQ